MPQLAPEAGKFDTASLYALLERFMVPDAVRASAYEGLAPADRARCKRTIARIFALYPPCARQESKTQELDGFWAVSSWQAVSSFLCLCSSRYPCPEALLAALVPAALARVEHIIVCFVDEGSSVDTPAPVPDSTFASLLAALDLGGFEVACCLPSNTVHKIIRNEKTRPGRVVMLGAVDQWESILIEAARQGIPTLPLPGLPAPQTAVFLNPAPGAGEQAARMPDNTKPFAAGLVLDADHEGIWLWPGLAPEWFRDYSLTLSSSCCS